MTFAILDFRLPIAKRNSRGLVRSGEGYNCANSGDSWSHVDVIANANGETQTVKPECLRVIREAERELAIAERFNANCLCAPRNGLQSAV